MIKETANTDSGMAQLDVFFSLFGIILVVLAVINLAVQQQNEPPNFSRYRPIDPTTSNIRLPMLDYVTPAYTVWYVTEKQIFRLKRKAIASQVLKVNKGQQGRSMISLKDNKTGDAGIFMLDQKDPSGYFLQLSVKQAETSEFFESLMQKNKSEADIQHAIIEGLQQLGRKPLALHWQKKAEKLVLLIETEGLKVGVSIHKAKSNDSHIILFRSPASFYDPSRAK